MSGVSGGPRLFEEDMKRWIIKVEARTRAVFVSTATKVHESIKEGSATTGAPGQPVDTGFLKGSWILAFTTPDTAEVRTNVAYAPVIEYGMKEAYDGLGEKQPAAWALRSTGKSTVGGSHSVALTLAGANRLQDEALAELGP